MPSRAHTVRVGNTERDGSPSTLSGRVGGVEGIPRERLIESAWLRLGVSRNSRLASAARQHLLGQAMEIFPPGLTEGWMSLKSWITDFIVDLEPFRCAQIRTFPRTRRQP
jgi:hypothetical protein